VQTEGFVVHLCSQPEYKGQLVHNEQIMPRPASYAGLSRPLAPALQRVLARSGIERFYSHQAQAINAAREGRSVMVATGTASGKTLCYNVPVLDAALNDPLSRALYLFPTKALAQDQLRALGELVSLEMKKVHLDTYDGDTAPAARTRIRKSATIVLSNPDMLHVGILPNHPHWASFFRHLRYVVLDEAHTYRGVFGSHIACLMRRLRRVCALYGADPQFILCSATIANPGEHAQRLTGKEMVIVQEDGAPQGPRQFVLWNPPTIDKAKTERRSINSEAAWILSEMAKQGVRNITFVRARKVAELILLYARQVLQRERPELVSRIASYRAGYRSEERREIEQRLFRGDLLGVTATNALELGIDIGQLDATVLVGYPGSIASTWQQAGRAGRGKREALNILIGQDNPLDQFFMRHPQELFGRPHEHALVDPGNLHILRAHLPCAALESPLRSADETLFGGTLDYRDERWCLVHDDYPAQHVNLRSTSGQNYLLVDETAGHRTLEEVDEATALFRIYPGAIFLHQADSYLVTHLDLGRHVAYARPVDVNYYTQPRELNDVRIVRSYQCRPLGSTTLYFGQVRVTDQVIGFRRRQQFTEALLSEEPLDLPSNSFETQAIWFEVPDAVRRAVVRRGLDFAGGLHAVEHACIGMLPLYALCDRNDIGGLSTPQHPDTGQPQVFIYDAYAGGVGIAKKGYEFIEELWQSTLDVVQSCPCESGCPSCIQSPKCGNNNEPLDKEAAVVILQALLKPRS
jgi:DEAD/DEAH box helicase domain-containing protein